MDGVILGEAQPQKPHKEIMKKNIQSKRTKILHQHIKATQISGGSWEILGGKVKWNNVYRYFNDILC